MKKAQISMEFLFSLGLIFLVFVILLFIIIDKQIETHNTEITLKKLSECQRFANIITALASSTDGTLVELKTAYYIKITNGGMIYANDENSVNNEVACSYSANPITASIYGPVKFKKSEGKINVIQ